MTIAKLSGEKEGGVFRLTDFLSVSMIEEEKSIVVLNDGNLISRYPRARAVLSLKTSASLLTRDAANEEEKEKGRKTSSSTKQMQIFIGCLKKFDDM